MGAVPGERDGGEARAELERIAPILLFLGAVIVLAELVKEAQVFDVIATRLAVVGRGNYAALFLLCTAFASLVTMVFLWTLFWRRGRRGADRYEPPSPVPVADPLLFRTAATVCALFIAALLLGLPIQAAALVSAVLMIAAFAWRDRSKLTFALFPWQLLVFVTGLFLVVPTLSRYGLAGLMGALAGTGGDGGGAYRAAAVGAGLSNLINNLPAYTAVEKVIPVDNQEQLLALFTGTDIGPVITPWASLATLLWFEWCRRRGVRVPPLTFVLAGAGLAVVGVTATVGVGVLLLTG